MRSQTFTLFAGSLCATKVPSDELAIVARAAANDNGPKPPMVEFVRRRRLDHFIDVAVASRGEIAAFLRDAFGDSLPAADVLHDSGPL